MSDPRESLAHRGPLIVDGIRWCKKCMRERRVDGGGELTDSKARKFWVCQTCMERRSTSIYSR